MLGNSVPLRRIVRLSLAAIALAVLPTAGWGADPAASSTASSPIGLGTETLVDMLRGERSFEDSFDAAFKAAIPKEKWQAILASLTSQYGQALNIVDADDTGPYSSTVRVRFEKGVGTFALSVTSNGIINGLLIKDFSATDDSIAKIDTDFEKLSGSSGYAVEELGNDGNIRILAGRNIDAQFAIGSTFKLYILAELAAEVQSGERKWADVTTLPHRSYSATALNRWPSDSLVTLQSLATWMISVSDNRATDNLLHLLGRERVESKLAMIGHSDPGKMLPLLSTVEAFALKSPGNSALRQAFLNANESNQRQLLMSNADKLGFDQVDPSMFASGPLHNDTIEWFASPADIGLVLDNIRRSGSKEALDILAINPGVISPGSKWKYVGYKGGSEPGVISMSYLLQSASGRWLLIGGSWNDKDKNVDETRFSMLIARLADQFAQ